MDMVCTRLWPASGLFVGKRIHADGRIEAAASIKTWRHTRLCFASLEDLLEAFDLDDLHAARELLPDPRHHRGASANGAPTAYARGRTSI